MHCIICIIFCLLLTLDLTAQTPFTKEFWLNETNVPVHVNDVLYAKTEFLWLATDNGLYRFDGKTFTLIADNIKQPVTALAEYSGNIYAGYKNGSIGWVHKDKIVSLKFSGTYPSSAISAIYPKGGLLYLTTKGEGLFVMINGVGLQLNTDKGLSDNFVYNALISDNELIAATDRGINIIRGENGKLRITAFTTRQGLPDNIVRVLKPVANSDLLWVGTQQSGIALYNNQHKNIHRPSMTHSWAWGQVNDILPLSDREAWIATDEKYLLHARIINDTLDIQPFTFDGVKFSKIVKDKAGNIWCGTNRGLMMLTALYATQLELPETFSLRDVTALTFDKSNNLWFTQNDVLYKISAGEKYPQRQAKTETAISALFADEKNNIWIGTFGTGIYFFSKGKLTPVTALPSLEKGHILSITGKKNKLWIASLNGVEETVITNKSPGDLQLLKHHNKKSGMGSDYVYRLYPDSKGNIWMATDGGGVRMYDGQRYHHWDTASGFTSPVVYSITEDAQGHIWAGTLEQGVFRFKNNRWQQFTRAEGLQNMNVYALAGTASGEVVMVNDDGIDQWHPSVRQFRHFNRRLNVHLDSTLTVPNCIARDTNGNVYLPFEHGFIIFKNQPEHFDISPAVHISSVNLFFKPLPTEQHEFSHDENHISFAYNGISYSNRGRLYFRYRLDNYDTTWISTNDEVVPFVQLPAGRYTFRIQAALNSNFDRVAEDSYSFTVRKPFWQHAWFIALVSLLVFGAGFAYVKAREQNLKKMSQLQKERMVFEYEHLKSQVNPHFLFNSLNTLANLIEEDKDAAVDYTVQLSDLYRNMLSYRDRDLISLDEEYEIITNYMYIQKSRFGNALRLETHIPETLFRTKKIVPLALQLLVENAIKHNIVSLSKPLIISIFADENSITVKNPAQPKASKEKGAGLGLINIRKRYALLTDRNMKFGRENGAYIVTLPLL